MGNFFNGLPKEEIKIFILGFTSLNSAVDLICALIGATGKAR